MENLFTELNAINVNEHTEKKKTGSTELTYLSWAWAWGEFKKKCPTATYEIKRFENNQPYFFDENLGYMVFTSVTVDNLTYEMWLPVMDSANKAMKKEPYTYQVKDKFTKNLVDKTCEAATMFDINKTIMRCLVKNLAMFGLGLYIYAGEDLPEDDKKTDAEIPETLKNAIMQAKDQQALNDIYRREFNNLTTAQQAEFVELCKNRKQELANANS